MKRSLSRGDAAGGKIRRTRRQATAGSLRGYAHLTQLGHDPGRLAALAPEVEKMFKALNDLWRVNVGDVEMAIVFDAASRRHE